MNNDNEKKKNSRLPVIIAAAVVLVVLMVILAVVLSKCSGNTDVQDAATSHPTETETETPTSAWDKATVIWTSTMSGNGMKFELRVKPGVNYTIVEHEEYYLCTLVAEDGKTVNIDLSGLIYETDLENLIGFFKQKNPQKLSIGKESETIITVYNPNETEAVFKLSDTDCLTVLGTDIETIADMLKNVMMKTGEKDYTVPDLNEEFEER